MKELKRNIYLCMKTLDEAERIWGDRVSCLRTRLERVPTAQALHRVTGEPLTARRSVPHYHGAAMDGYAVKARATYGAGDVRPMILKVGENAFPVDTGDPLPGDTDAVIMIEHVQPVKQDEIEIRAAAFPWQHVRKVGEDIVAGELILPLNHLLRPVDLGALLAAGVLEVPVYAKPKVWIQPTGTELVAAEEAAESAPGQIVEFNGVVLSGLVRECGGEPLLQPIIDDRYPVLRERMEAALASEADVVLFNAGSSAGTEDYTAAILGEVGEVLVHGVTMMPGKPTLLGLARGKPVVGIPGYPVSALLAFEQFVRPLLFSLQGVSAPAFPETEAILGRKLPSRLGLEEFVRVILGRVAGKLVAMPLQRGAGVITSLTRADGILRIPQELEGMEVAAPTKVRLLRSREQLDRTLIMIGSHDNTLDVLANELKKRDSRVHLSSSNVGSLGGLLAVRQGHCHLAGSHLLDTVTGEYNFSHIERYLKGTPVRLVRLAARTQGFLLKPGNPKGIRGVRDLVRPDVTFLNRQAGSGTRILLDYLLQKEDLASRGIVGYDQEEFTHMAVAVNVLSGRADTGMAIFAAARALDLDFVPVTEEQYDLVIPESEWEDPKVRMLLDIVVSGPFRRTVAAMGGYDTARSGELVGRWDGREWLLRERT